MEIARAILAWTLARQHAMTGGWMGVLLNILCVIEAPHVGSVIEPSRVQDANSRPCHTQSDSREVPHRGGASTSVDRATCSPGRIRFRRGHG